MKKKLLSILLCATLAAAALAGCSSAPKNGGAAEDAKTEGQAETNDSAPTEEEAADSQAEEPEDDPEAPVLQAVDQKKVFVSPEWVQSVVDGGQPESSKYVILECAWGEEEFDPAYAEGHIQGAFHMNTDYVEEEVYWNIRPAEEIADLMKKYGITKDTTVICYSDTGSNSADDRIAFTMLWAGVENVKCLDGGLEAWTKAGFDLEAGSIAPVATEEDFGIDIPAHPEYIISIDDTKEKLKTDENFRLVSIRSQAEFLGETSGYSYISKAGEPEGAIWGHDTDDGSYNKEDGTIVGTDVLEGYLAESSASLDNELAFYCGTGWRACMPFLLCYENGIMNVSLYDGGWFQWQMDDSLPVQVGDPLSDDCVYTTVGELSNDKAAE